MRPFFASRLLVSVAAASVGLALWGCATTGEKNGGGRELNDASIDHVMIAITDIDTRMAEVALTKVSDPSIREYASRVLSDQRTAKGDLNRLVQRMGMVPDTNDTSRKLHEKADKKLEDLRKLEARKSEREYVEQQLAFHKDVRELIDDKLLPGATSSELTQEIRRIRTRLEDHQRMARSLEDQRVSEVRR